MPGIIGQPVDRIDGTLKVTGRAVYAYEQQVENAAYGVLITSTIPKGRITAIDSSAAEKSRGVLLVMSHLNAPKLAGLKDQKPSPITGRVIQAFQDDLARYAGQPVALVVAETLEQAIEGAHLVGVKYAIERHAVDLDGRISQAYEPPKAGGQQESSASNRGNMQSGMAEADSRMHEVYRTPYEFHNPMEQHATIAVWDKPDHLTLYDSTQGVFPDRERVAHVFSMPSESIHVISPFIGGGFGSKGPVWSHVVIAAMAAKQLNRPVRLEVQRPQMFGPVGMRSQTRQTLAIGAKTDGSITALSHDTVCQTSSFDQFVETASFSARRLYTAPNNSTSHLLIKSDIGQPSYTRAPGEAPGTYALEAAMDEMAYQLKMDPIEFRLKNYTESDAHENKPWSSKSLRECYRQGAERFGWSNRTPEPRSMRKGNVLVGYGMATSVYPTRRSPASASARLNNDGTLSVDAGTQDIGTGTYTVMTQVAADTFGLPMTGVKFRLGDTDLPKTPVSGGSQTAASTGSAVYLATQALREKLIQMATSDAQSPLSGVSAQDIEIQNGRIFARSNPSKGEALGQLLARSGQPFAEGKADAKPGSEKERYSMYAFGAQFSEVHVDADLGQIRVARHLGCFGAGRILNAKTARSQLLGGMIWGVGMALLEGGVMDDRLGRYVNNNLAEYHVPVNADIGVIDAFWVDEKDEHVNPLGVKGVGEIGITGATAAIVNAIYHATGKRVRDLPVKLDKLLV